MRKTPWVMAVALLCAATLMPVAQGLAASLSSPATPPPVVAAGVLPISGVTGFVADSAHHHLFIATGDGDNSVLVTDDAGTPIASLPVSTAADISLYKNYLYVAEPMARDIAVVDTASLTVVSRIPTASGSCPESVTFVASRYLVYAADCSLPTQALGVIDLASHSMTPQFVAVSAPLFNPIVRAVPGTTHVILTNSLGSAPSASVIDVAGSPRIIATVPGLSNGCGWVQDLAVSADGKTFVPACESPYEHDAFSTTDLTQVDSYLTHWYPDAAAFSPNGKFFAGGTDYAGVYLFPLTSTGHGEPQVDTVGPGVGNTVTPHGLAFSSNSNSLFVITRMFDETTFRSTYRLRVFSTRPSTPHLSLAASRSSGVGTALQVSGQLEFSDSSQRDGTQLRVTRKVNGVTTVLPPVSTSLGENQFVILDTPTAVGRTTYTVTYPGDALDRRITKSVTVSVAKVRPVMTVTSNVAAGGSATVMATLVGGSTNRVVTITATPSKGKAVVIATGPVDSRGRLTATYAQKTTTKFTASYAGDDQYLSDSVHVTASAKVSPTPSATDPSRTATVALVNNTSHDVSLSLSDSDFNRQFVVRAHGVDRPFDYTTCDPTVACNDGIALVASGGYGMSDAETYFAPGHSYLVEVAYEPTLYPGPDGPQLAFHIIEVG